MYHSGTHTPYEILYQQRCNAISCYCTLQNRYSPWCTIVLTFSPPFASHLHLCVHIECLYSELVPLEEIHLSLQIDTPHLSFTFTHVVVCLTANVYLCVCVALNSSEVRVCYCLYETVIVMQSYFTGHGCFCFRVVLIRLKKREMCMTWPGGQHPVQPVRNEWPI